MMRSTPAGTDAPAIYRWRQTQRERLLAQRLAFTPLQRRARDQVIEAHLHDLLEHIASRARITTVGVYWPIKGEPKLRAWMTRLHAQGLVCALPVVRARGQALVFHAWQPGAKMVRGLGDIPVPARPQEVQPELLVAPMLGFDPQGYRLGYGGGYYDRTLATLTPRPIVIGVADASAWLPTIHPLPHDIAMDHVVTARSIIA